MDADLKLKISMLPDSPGVYLYYNNEGKVIYVGKAKRLKRRVSSYFNREHAVARTNLLVRNIADLRFIVVNTEEEALDLENSLIKEYQPRYNVLLKDDKSYPWICVSRETYPRVFITREERAKGAKYYGPYPKAEVAHALLDVLRKLYPLRTCRHALTPELVAARRYPLCLQYHIKNCEGCCQGFVTPEEYGEHIAAVRQILNGDTKQVSDYLYSEMMVLAEQLKFEQAEEIKRKYRLIENYRARSVIVNPSIHNVDVFAIKRDDTAAYINYMHMRNGSIVQGLTVEYKFQDRDCDESDAEILSTAIRDMRARFPDTYAGGDTKELIVNVMPDFKLQQLTYTVPQRGDKRKLLAIALKNVDQFMADKLKRMEKLNPEQRVTRLLTTMQRDLRLTVLPHHVECFDNSSTGGENAVASCVVFRDGKPSKKEYRHFNIKQASGLDDYAQMREVLTRRYTRLLEEQQSLPQLVIVDGGKGQLSAAVEVMDELGLRGRVALIGIAKRLDELFFPGDSVPLYIDRNSDTLRVIQHLRDEAHRFGIAHHRKRRSKSQIHSLLDDIEGVGEKTKTLLLKQFKSFKRVNEASPDELAALLGPARGARLHAALHPDNENKTNP